MKWIDEKVLQKLIFWDGNSENLVELVRGLNEEFPKPLVTVE